MNKKRKLKFLSFLLVTALLINSFMASVSYAKPKVKLNKTKITLTIGNSVLLKVKNTKVKPKWSSSNKSVAKVTSNGDVIAKKAGKAKITAKVGKKKYTCNVTVPKQYISATSLTVYVGENKPITIYGTFFEDNIKWRSKNSNIATVSKDGIITGLREGTTAIYGTVNNGKGKTYRCKITVFPNSIPTSKPTVESTQKPFVTNEPEITKTPISNATPEPFITVTGVMLSETSITLRVYETRLLSANVLPLNATNKKVIWSSANDNIVRIDNNGIVTGVSVGTTDIYVITEDGGYIAQCNVTVTALNQTVTPTPMISPTPSQTVNPTVSPTPVATATITPSISPIPTATAAPELDKERQNREKLNNYMSANRNMLSSQENDEDQDYVTIEYQAYPNDDRYIFKRYINGKNGDLIRNIEIKYVFTPDKTNVINIEYDLRFNNKPYDGTARFDASTYIKGQDFNFSGTFKNYINVYMKEGFQYWEELLQKNVNLSISDIGFSSFNKNILSKEIEEKLKVLNEYMQKNNNKLTNNATTESSYAYIRHNDTEYDDYYIFSSNDIDGNTILMKYNPRSYSTIKFTYEIESASGDYYYIYAESDYSTYTNEKKLSLYPSENINNEYLLSWWCSGARNSIKEGFERWKDILENQVGITFENLGFNNYQ